MVSRREFFTLVSSSLVLLPLPEESRQETPHHGQAQGIHGSNVARTLMKEQGLQTLMHLWHVLASKSDKINIEQTTK